MYPWRVPKLWTETIEEHRHAVHDATLDTTAAIGLAIGGALGMAGTFVASDALRETLWTIDRSMCGITGDYTGQFVGARRFNSSNQLSTTRTSAFEGFATSPDSGVRLMNRPSGSTS